MCKNLNKINCIIVYKFIPLTKLNGRYKILHPSFCTKWNYIFYNISQEDFSLNIDLSYIQDYFLYPILLFK